MADRPKTAGASYESKADPVAAALSSLQEGKAPGDAGPPGTAPVAPGPAAGFAGNAGPGGTAPVAPGPLPYDPHTAPVAPNAIPVVTPVAPKIKPLPKTAGISGPEEQVRAVNSPGPELSTSGGISGPQEQVPDTQAAVAKAAQEIKKDPTIGEKLLQLAKDTGKTALELLQGFAAGYSGSNIPLASQVREAEKQIKMQQDAQMARQQADEAFQQKIAGIQNDWANSRFAATTQAERDAADKERAFQAEQAAKDRELTRETVMKQTTFAQQGRALTREQQAADIVRQILGGG